MEFIETPSFTKIINALLSDEDYRAFQNDLLERPEAGSRIPGALLDRKTHLAGAVARNAKNSGCAWQPRETWWFSGLVLLLPRSKRHSVGLCFAQK
jgi:hypothetical protein